MAPRNDGLANRLTFCFRSHIFRPVVAEDFEALSPRPRARAGYMQAFWGGLPRERCSHRRPERGRRGGHGRSIVLRIARGHDRAGAAVLIRLTRNGPRGSLPPTRNRRDDSRRQASRTADGALRHWPALPGPAARG